MASNPALVQEPIRLGEGYELDLRLRRLRRGRHIIRLERIPLEILSLLVQNAGETVSRDEIIETVWGKDVFLDTDNSIRGAIRKLRQALKDDADSPRFIQTVTGRGYRFIAPAAMLRNASPGPSVVYSTEINAETVPTQGVPRRRTALVLAAVCILVILVPAGILLMRQAAGKFAGASRRPVVEKRITSNSPEAPIGDAVVSPDGKYLAYSDPFELFLRVIATGEARRWDLPKGFIAQPKGWFPDGTHLLVIHWEGTPPVPSLWKLSLLGGSPQKLFDPAAFGSVSPDGTRIAFGTFLPAWGRELWVMGADGSNPHKIAVANQGADPGTPSGIMAAAWSPSGRRIACIERYGFAGLSPATDLSTLWTRDAEGGDLQVVSKNTWLGTALSWAPDGRILYPTRADSAREGDNDEMRSIRVDERTGKAVGTAQIVTAGAGTISAISATSDGERVVLVRTSSHEQAFISEFDAESRRMRPPRRLTLDANSNVATAWLSDSKTVLFVSNRNGTWTLFKQGIDEAMAQVLVEGHSIYLPRLSADGSQVLYGSNPDPANPSSPVSLMRLPVGGGPPRLIVRDVGIGNYQCARLPSTLCIFDRARGNDFSLISFDPVRGVGRELFKSNAGPRDWSLSPDGRTLIDSGGDGHTSRFYSIRNGEARLERTIRLNDWRTASGDWTADSKGILTTSVTPTGHPVILELNRAGKASVILEGTAGTSYDYVIQSPDGRRGILGAGVPGDNNAWAIDNF